MNVLSEFKDDYIRAQALVNTLIERATTPTADDFVFFELRNYFLNDSNYSSKLPHWFPAIRSLNQFWAFIKDRYGSYAERRNFLWSEFESLLKATESKNKIPTFSTITEALNSHNIDGISEQWSKILFRTKEDPSGSITASRSLLESVLKYILDERDITYDDDKAELATLYKAVQEELRLGPSHHQEQIFKQILTGCRSIVDGLGAMRNKLGDAHGSGKMTYRPSPRHANLAVTLAGAMSQFLLDTHKENIKEARISN